MGGSPVQELPPPSPAAASWGRPSGSGCPAPAPWTPLGVCLAVWADLHPRWPQHTRPAPPSSAAAGSSAHAYNHLSDLAFLPILGQLANCLRAMTNVGYVSFAKPCFVVEALRCQSCRCMYVKKDHPTNCRQISARNGSTAGAACAISKAFALPDVGMQ